MGKNKPTPDTSCNLNKIRAVAREVGREISFSLVYDGEYGIGYDGCGTHTHGINQSIVGGIGQTLSQISAGLNALIFKYGSREKAMDRLRAAAPEFAMALDTNGVTEELGNTIELDKLLDHIEKLL
jgi:hypothetical protein